MSRSYLTSSQKLTLNNEFFNLHDTFARPIVIYQTAYETIISSDPNANILFDKAPFNGIQHRVIQSGVFQARILYGKKETLGQFAGVASDQTPLLLEEGDVRIRVDATGAALISSSERVTFDSAIFDVQTSIRPHGLVGPPNFFDFYLKKSQ